MSGSTWRQMLDYQLAKHNETLLSIVPDESVLDVEFDDGYGGTEGPAFTAWSQTRVYFPVVYDGAEWLESVPRDPCDEVTHHIGGG